MTSSLQSLCGLAALCEMFLSVSGEDRHGGLAGQWMGTALGRRVHRVPKRRLPRLGARRPYEGPVGGAVDFRTLPLGRSAAEDGPRVTSYKGRATNDAGLGLQLRPG